MGNHRMFSNTIVDSDKFLDMPLTTQALYFHLGMKADDEGFVGNPKKITRSVSCTEDDLKLLIAKGFAIAFASGVIVITHWNIHNHIRKDRKKATIFLEEKLQLALSDSNVYTDLAENGNQVATICQPSGNQLAAQGKVSKGKVSKGNISLSTSVDREPSFDYQAVIDSFNNICHSLPKVKKLTDKRRKAIKSAVSLVGDMTLDEVFAIVERSDFLTGRSDTWSCGFDWIMKTSNLTKIIEGTYDNKSTDSDNNSIDDINKEVTYEQ